MAAGARLWRREETGPYLRACAEPPPPKRKSVERGVVGLLRAVRTVLGLAGAAASAAAWVLAFVVARRVAEAESPLAGVGFLVPLALALLGLVCLLAAWRWRWALLVLAGDALAAVGSLAYLARLA